MAHIVSRLRHLVAAGSIAAVGSTAAIVPGLAGLAQVPTNACSPSSNANANSLLNLNLAIPIQLLSGIGLLGQGTANQGTSQVGNAASATSSCSQQADASL
jgi:aryl-alcohol dehydrogenase-like predicted oxidoreductase